MSRQPVEPKISQIHPHAAGIDIGAETHWVSVPVGRDHFVKTVPDRLKHRSAMAICTFINFSFTKVSNGDWILL
ncbi:hypothetical protein BST81_02855 [Leptolyngbya sp. 'hensonii']|nr:hypothetical protein BST81_02855 [Leptolyngbya sp. 'hensonii']